MTSRLSSPQWFSQGNVIAVRSKLDVLHGCSGSSWTVLSFVSIFQWLSSLLKYFFLLHLATWSLKLPVNLPWPKLQQRSESFSPHHVRLLLLRLSSSPDYWDIINNYDRWLFLSHIYTVFSLQFVWRCGGFASFLFAEFVQRRELLGCPLSKSTSGLFTREARRVSRLASCFVPVPSRHNSFCGNGSATLSVARGFCNEMERGWTLNFCGSSWVTYALQYISVNIIIYFLILWTKRNVLSN